MKQRSVKTFNQSVWNWRSIAAAAVGGLSLILAISSAQAQRSILVPPPQTRTAAEPAIKPVVKPEADAPVDPVVSQIQSVSLFKNGVALIREDFFAPQSGQFALDAVPYAIHGTFFIQSTANVEAVLTQRPCEESVGAVNDLNYQKDLTGKKVRVYFTNANLPPVDGTVAEVNPSASHTVPPPAASDATSRYYLQYASSYYSSRRDPFETPNAASPILVLNTKSGQTVLQQSSIARIDVEGEIGTVTRTRPTLLFNVQTDKPAKISVSYLTKGIAWAPAYKIQLPNETSNRGTMTIEQTATLVNQWRDFRDAEVSLISGYPKIGCENVVSPISNKANLSAFFNQMLRPESGDRGNMMSQMVMNSRMPDDDANDFPSGSVAASGDGPDIYYHAIGVRSMNKEEVLALSNGKKEAEFERIVEWTVSNPRDEYGRDRGDQQNSNTPWDSIQFINPFDFPMTTGPAAIVTEKQFLGQSTSYWTSPGERTTIPITKSLSVSVKADEKEVGRTDELHYMGVRCRRITVAVELTIANRRAEPIKAVIKKQFSGELENPVEGAKVVQINQNLNALNRQNEIRWELPLQSGEKKTLKFEYFYYLAY